jgi:hypothetical protein
MAAQVTGDSHPTLGERGGVVDGGFTHGQDWTAE